MLVSYKLIFYYSSYIIMFLKGLWLRKWILSGMILASVFVVPWLTQEIKPSLTEIYEKTIWTVTQEWKTLIDKLINQQETKKMKRALILHYCDTLFQKEHAKDWNKMLISYADYIYDPRQSLFVYSLCVNIDEVSNGRKILNEKYVYRNYKREFDTISYTPLWASLKMNDYIKEDVDFNSDVWNIPRQTSLDADAAYSDCNPATSMQWCNFASFLPKIFSTIMNEYSNMKLWSVYWYQQLPVENADQLWNSQDPVIKKAVEQFARTYFGSEAYDKAWKPIWDDNVPCNNPNITYLDPSDPSWESAHCSHPKAYEFVANTLKWAKRLIDKTKLIDGKKVMSEQCKWNERDLLLMRCAFSTYWDVSFASDMKSFSNLLLNELMRYNLFVTYYTQAILYDPVYHPLTIWSTDFAYQLWVKEYTTLQYEQWMAKHSISQMVRMIHQIATNFPIHVGMIAYHEDILNLRKTITKSYTPFHQLAYKRRNVQACME